MFGFVRSIFAGKAILLFLSYQLRLADPDGLGRLSGGSVFFAGVFDDLLFEVVHHILQSHFP